MKLLSVFVFVSTMFFSQGCAFVKSPVLGVLYTGAKAPVLVGPGKKSSKTGKACASSILGLIATGDASIGAATAQGKIRRIHHVDSEAFSILGLYATYCTVVKGS